MINLTKDIILPGATIGIVGGGQLGRMMITSAKEMGYKVIVLDPTADCPAGQMADSQIVASYDDFEALKELAEKSDVVTYEFENVSVETLEKLSDIINLPQGTNLLAKTQDRLTEKEFLESCGVDIAPHKQVETSEQLGNALEEIGYPSVLKTIRGGYDGKGQYVLKSVEDISDAEKLLSTGAVCELEAWVPFDKEISVIVAGNGYEFKVFPVVENIHVNNILHETIAPARVSDDISEKAKKIGLIIAEKLDLRGVLAIEMFLTKDGKIYVNELAPRPHNSGHYSIEACNFSQFDAHIRGVLGWPLADVELLSPALMVNILGQHLEGTYDLISQKNDWHFHYYGKDESKVNRKMGHITILTDCIENTLSEVDENKNW
ncbi:5-(carboxyamino)imidazole ribonucleotide synthase [Floricoccus penangensis]|uniref:5-(carboxyamino)imidazole ribonucleotide synthase n=1 Tax=Floricoccus penangensis TaxID=1859475 RepID=UPI00203CDB7C|nr:5-(carboxyamino)imidazole ribonucleotide synthase [Floricoccus penangensis]URZ88323.1 5-(carboxyamino)imidazole ribonucleotide synthase [Floricoccus penangensis]